MTSGSVSLDSPSGSHLSLPQSNMWHLLHVFDSTVAWQPRRSREEKKEPFLSAEGEFCSAQKCDDRCSILWVLTLFAEAGEVIVVSN